MAHLSMKSDLEGALTAKTAFDIRAGMADTLLDTTFMSANADASAGGQPKQSLQGKVLLIWRCATAPNCYYASYTNALWPSTHHGSLASTYVRLMSKHKVEDRSLDTIKQVTSSSPHLEHTRIPYPNTTQSDFLINDNIPQLYLVAAANMVAELASISTIASIADFRSRAGISTAAGVP